MERFNFTWRTYLIRDVKTEDEIPFVKMAADGSLNDCGFDRDCGNWITKWIDEARGFTFRDNPNMDYFFNHYKAKRMNATVRDENIPSWKVIEKVGYILNEKECIKI